MFTLETMEVLVPKRRGNGFLKVPYGHHDDPKLNRIAGAARCDVSGLDGSLSFECRGKVCCFSEKRKEFAEKVMPLLEKHYGFPYREASESEFYKRHPIVGRNE